MADFAERKVGALMVRIDRMTCAAFKDCIGLAPEAFELGEDDIVAFKHPEQIDRERLIEACAICPVNALIVLDENGNQIVP
jgi:ferredoxin